MVDKSTLKIVFY